MSLLIVAVLYGLWVAAFWTACVTSCRQIWCPLVPIAGLVVGYFVHAGCVVLYLDLEMAFATTMEQKENLAASDGAKLVFHGLFFAPATTCLNAFVGTVLLCWRAQRNHDGG